MDGGNDWLAEDFERQRPRLRAVAYRLLGSAAEADDAVQEAWLRLNRATASPDGADIANLGGWLTTVVSRLCLDQLRARQAHRETELDENLGAAEFRGAAPTDRPDHEALLADAVGTAMLVVLEKLAPAERVAFVLHDLFDLPFDDIAAIVGRSPEATRQLASRARRRVRGAEASGAPSEYQRRVVEAFFVASRGGDLQALLQVLAPDIVLRADAAAVEFSTRAGGRAGAMQLHMETHGAAAVARTFQGQAQAARLALVDGAWGMVWAPGGVKRAVFRFSLRGPRISGIEIVCDPQHIQLMNIGPLQEPPPSSPAAGTASL